MRPKWPSSNELDAKAAKRAEAKAKKQEEINKQLQEREPGEQPDPNAEP